MPLLQSVLTFCSNLQSQNFLFLAMTFFFPSFFLFTWPQISLILHTLFSPLDPFLVICHIVSREESPLSPEQQVLWTPVLNPGGTALPGEHHDVSSMELSPATDDLRSLPLTGRFCSWLSGHFSARQSCKKQTAMHFFGCPTAISTPCM